MEGLVRGIGLRKMILIIVVPLVVLGIVFLFISQETSTTGQSSPNSEQIAKEAEKIPENPTTSKSTAAPWKTYSNQYFTINYPQDYVLTDGVFDQNGTLTTFSKNDTKVLVQTTVDPKMQSKEIVNRYTNLGYTSVPITIANTSGTLISGTVADAFSEKGYIFDFNSRTYRIMCIYPGQKDT